MKKEVLIVLVVIAFAITLVHAEVWINEVMANTPASPYGSSKCEWVEIYTDSEVNITNWTLNTGAQEDSFSFNLIDFLIITGDKDCFLDNWDVNTDKVIDLSIALNNKEEDVSLIDNESNIVGSIMSYANSHNDKSWQHCSNEWIENPETPGEDNNCTDPETQTDPPEEDEPYVEVSWDKDDIINGEEFEIRIKGYDLEDDDYDVQIWIVDEDEDTTISKSFNEKDDKWKSKTVYHTEILIGPGDEIIDILMKIDSEYEDFYGDATIFLRVRESDSKDQIEDLEETIEILEKVKKSSSDNNQNNPSGFVRKSGTSSTSTNNNNDDSKETTSNVISLGTKKSDTTELNNESKVIKSNVYKSKNEKMKNYAIYGFAFFCLVLAILMGMEKLN